MFLQEKTPPTYMLSLLTVLFFAIGCQKSTEDIEEEKSGKAIPTVGVEEEKSGKAIPTVGMQELVLPDSSKVRISFVTKVALSSQQQKIALSSEGRTYQRIYVTNFPPQEASDYKSVLELPNYITSSPVAWCAEDSSRLAIAYLSFKGEKAPDIMDHKEFQQWVTDNPERIPSGGFPKVLNDERSEQNLVVFSDEDGVAPQFFPAPKVEGASSMGRITWASASLLYYGLGNSVFKLDLGESSPTLKLVWEDGRSENSSLRALAYDQQEKTLYVLKTYYPQSGEKTYQVISLREDGDSVALASRGDLSLEKSCICFYVSAGETKCFTMGNAHFYFGDLKEQNWETVPFDNQVADIPQPLAFSSGNRVVVFSMFDRIGYRSFEE